MNRAAHLKTKEIENSNSRNKLYFVQTRNLIPCVFFNQFWSKFKPVYESKVSFKNNALFSVRTEKDGKVNSIKHTLSIIIYFHSFVGNSYSLSLQKPIMNARNTFDWHRGTERSLEHENVFARFWQCMQFNHITKTLW